MPYNVHKVIPPLQDRLLEFERERYVRGGIDLEYFEKSIGKILKGEIDIHQAQDFHIFPAPGYSCMLAQPDSTGSA